MNRILSAAVVLGALVFPLCSNAQVTLSEAGPKPTLDQLHKEGWLDVAPGVLQRALPGQPLETIAFGSDGLQRALNDVRARFEALLKVQEKAPSEEVEKALHSLRAEIARLQQAIASKPSTDMIGQTGGCDISFGCSANASQLYGSQGVSASSSAYFANNCSYSGTVYAEAYGTTNAGTDFQSRTLTGTNVTKSASISTAGAPTCSSSAYSYASIPALSVFYSCSQANSSCPAPPVNGSLFGPSYIYVSGYDCVTEYWSASASGGTPPYSFSWSSSHGSGTGSSFSLMFCGSGTTYNETVTVYLTTTDSASGSDSDGPLYTTVQYQGNDCYYPQYLTPGHNKVIPPICEPY